LLLAGNAVVVVVVVVVGVTVVADVAALDV
jgi:hypothetical protein